LSSPFGFPDAFPDEVSFSALAIFRRNLSLAISILRFDPLCAMQFGLFKKPKFFAAFLSVGGLLPEDSILKERLVLFLMIE
jgi:hypothetical protein